MEGRKKGANNKYLVDVSTKDFYAYYKANIKEQSVYDMKQNKFTEILRFLNTEISKLIISTNFEYHMIPNLGNLSIKKFKTKLKLDEHGKIIKRKLPIDYGKTRALWAADESARNAKKLVYYLNDHSNGYRYKFHWDRSTCTVKNKSFYKFVASRTNNRLINIAVRTIEDLDFFEFKTKIYGSNKRT